MSSPLPQFLRERFPLGEHAFMVAVFAFANVSVVAAMGEPLACVPWRLVAAWLLALGYFFRLRCFDEIKDYDFDRLHNPERPLARGLVTKATLLRWICVAAAVELLLAFALAGAGGMLLHAVAQGYSLLMYREFFIARWLRPHLTTYAVTHTVSAAFLGGSVGMLYARTSPSALGPRALFVLLFNWWLFNLFEFARKTWAPDEERPEVDSYSLRFGVLGAVLLSLSQVALGIAFTTLLSTAKVSDAHLSLQLVLAFLPLAAGLAFAARRTARSAALYRNVVSVYLVLFYAGLAFGHAPRALFSEDSHAGSSELDLQLRAA